MMMESTFFTMFNLNCCIELTYAQLDCLVEKVDAKIAQFSNIASAETKDASNAIRASECFNAHNIDCELLALIFSKPIVTIRVFDEEYRNIYERRSIDSCTIILYDFRHVHGTITNIRRHCEVCKQSTCKCSDKKRQWRMEWVVEDKKGK
ncbi:hypothetical protein DMN91_011474 [Ooceraea biroi]|uniref:Uncharacterized protein n=1 Tax=Ooceraea biroi TaxID=2015173 RepID=A0A3L8D657_OOCBI|nr:hypothetical protein DMN91_011474 [Ooceraea biroi]